MVGVGLVVTMGFSHSARRQEPHAAMSSSPRTVFGRISLLDVFAQVPDPRDPRGVRHPLPGILAVA